MTALLIQNKLIHIYFNLTFKLTFLYIYSSTMGRKKLYQTKEELILKRREYVSKYYYKNKSKIDARSRERYKERKDREGLLDNQSSTS